MLAQIAEQHWPGPRFDEETRTEIGVTWAAATWEAPAGGGRAWVVREWFITDGRSMANAALVGTCRAAVAAATDAANKLLLSALFA